jgi:hypothetical protein
MKKRVLYILLLCLAPIIASAQVGKYRSDLAIGVNGGLAINSVTFSPRIQQSMHLGPELGVSIRYTCEKYFAAVCALQAEINFTNLGWREVPENGSYTYIRNMNYIQVPFMTRMGFGRERKGAMGYIILGPQLGFCIGENDIRLGEWGDATNPYDPQGPLINVPKKVEGAWQQYNMAVEKKFQYGIAGGAGVEFSHPKVGHIALEGRYYFGLSDIFKNGKKDTFGRSANSTITVKLSYFWDIKKTKDNSIK